MDCEKFESTMIDELYDELDELRIAAWNVNLQGGPGLTQKCL